MRAKLAPLAEQRTRMLYDALQQERYSEVQKGRLALDHHIEYLKCADGVLGKVETYEITNVTAGLVVLPVVVTVKTNRGGKAFEESTVMHWDRGGPLILSIHDSMARERIERHLQNMKSLEAVR